MIYVIGIGPGCKDLMTQEAIKAMEDAEVIVGYKTYIDLVKEFIVDKEVVQNGMRKEIERCKEAIEIAKTGKKVAVISSGDAGIYGMAGLILELITKEDTDIKVKVVPGVTASIGAAAVLGAPIMHDFCHISLSDLLTPWEVIEKRLRLAAEADFVICLYNPRSKGRSEHENKFICTFDTMDFERVDMTTMVIIGNKSTYIHDDLMITPRGYTV